MASGFFNVGVTGLNAAQIGLVTTSHNIANASTPGYSRQVIHQINNTPLFTGSGFIGTGTSVETIRRVYNEFLSAQVLAADTAAAELEMYAGQISQIDNILADPSAGLSPALTQFFAAVSDVTTDPASIPARQALVSAGQTLAARFQSLDQQLGSLSAGVNTQLSAEVTSINSLVRQIADINQRIIIAEGAGPGQPANDLYDQRDQLVADLNKKIKVTVLQETDGSYSLFFGTGQPLVVGTLTYSLVAQPSQEDLSRLEIGLKSASGDVVNLPDSLISGGSLGGMIGFRSGTLDEALNALGTIAASVVNTVNTQHALGIDLQGNAGGAFFKPLAPTMLAAPGNTGTGKLGAVQTTSDYRIEFNGTEFAVTRLSDNRRTTHPALPINIDGLRFTLSTGNLAGTAAQPDVFIVRPGLENAQRVVALAGNPGSAQIASTGSNIQTMGSSDYRLRVNLNGTLTLERLSDGAAWTGSGATQQAALDDILVQAAPVGFNLELTGGNLASGDSFLSQTARYAARDFALAITDPRAIAAAQNVRTKAALSNAGTGTISAGEVLSTTTRQAAPFELTYEASSNSLIGFPVGSRVEVGTQVFNVSSPTQRVPFAAGANVSLNGIAFVVDGVPTDGDRFVIDPRPGASPTAARITDLLGMAADNGQAVVTGATAIETAVTVPAGGLTFNVAVDGGATTALTLPAGTYAPAALAAALNGLVAGIPSSGTVTLDANDKLVFSAATSIAIGEAGASGTASVRAGRVTAGGSLPGGTITLTYRQSNGSYPPRLEGFPEGSRVLVTPPNGVPTEYVIDKTDGISDYIPFVANARIEFNGIAVTLAGQPAEGDQFAITPNPSGVGDNRNMLAIGLLQTANTMGDGSASYASAYGQMIATVGNKAREIDVNLTAQENLAENGRATLQSISGVNLDEEAANLLRYQQAYQAAAKMMDLASSLFGEILAIARS